MNDPTTIEECDAQLAFFSELSQRLELPVVNEDGTDGLDRLLDIRNELARQQPATK